ncbi:hypothetical protein [Novipirellula artificiosorum]|uniref:Uncharacterized protein n=1 Tax=Novipirellula artificiosorum TaxID=2528016 RepID=A0A5C6E5H3_9BACT|nr:hypothetical protein [Novipirellula artificiosorum]TWU42399.1 hypothetical protein Poly41_06960 [Novipirellula artificiosorum]
MKKSDSARTDADLSRIGSRKSSAAKRSIAGKSSAGAIAMVVLLGFYSFAQPRLNERFGWDLPELRTNDSARVSVNSTTDIDTAPQNQSRPSTTSISTEKSSSPKPSQPTAIKKDSSKDESAKPGESERALGPLADRMSPTKSSSTVSTAKSEPDASVDELLYGLLREVSPRNYLSPSGLQYTPGSAEGHRLEHLRRHTEDDPSRQGSHGVFDGEMEGALKTIEKAYQRAKSGQRTTKTTDQGRTIYTVDMGSRVGYVGGRDGNRKRKPMARRVRLVLEGNRVITAYPM